VSNQRFLFCSQLHEQLKDSKQIAEELRRRTNLQVMGLLHAKQVLLFFSKLSTIVPANSKLQTTVRN
jgi:hypothetical protein